MNSYIFTLHDGAGSSATITVPVPRRFYRRWMLAVALWLWEHGNQYAEFEGTIQ